MPFYNCFLGEYVSNIDFTFKSVSNNAPKGYKIASIPVRFDTEYQIGLDCSTGIELLCVIYGNKGNIESLTTVLNNESSYNNSSPQQRYKSYVKTVGCSLRHPFAYHTPSWDNGEIPTTDGKLNDLGQYERDLRLLVKIPEGNSSSIVVLEMESKDKKSIQMVSGDYISPRYIEDSIVSESLLSPLSLLQMSNGENYAFSDRLIEYLTLSVIDSKDEISGNIKRTQQYITNQNFIKYNATYRQSDSE